MPTAYETEQFYKQRIAIRITVVKNFCLKSCYRKLSYCVTHINNNLEVNKLQQLLSK